MNCIHCGAEIDDDARFCLKCGKPIENDNGVNVKTCPKCGALMESDALFCTKCGHGEKGKKKPIGLIIPIVIVVILVVTGGTGVYMHQKAEREAYEVQLAAERQRQAEIHEFQKKSIELYDAINGAKSNFNLMSTMYSTSTELNTGLLGPSFFTSYIEGLCSSELTAEKSRKREVDSLYSEFSNLKCNEEEISELKKVMDNYYYAYEDRYELLVEGDFSVYSFSSEDKASSSDFDEKSKAAEQEINNIDKDALDDTSEETKGGTTL